MSFINYSSREVNCKLVYYGPGLGGQNHQPAIHLRPKPPRGAGGKMISLATETERTLFFDFLPLSLGEVRGFKTRFHLYTVPGQSLLRCHPQAGAAGRRRGGLRRRFDPREDAGEPRIAGEPARQPGREEATIRTCRCVQYNKRDLPNCVSVEEIRRT